MDSTRPPTEVVGKDREPQELPHAPPRLLEKRTGAGRPNGQPRPVDHTENLPLSAPEFTSVSFQSPQTDKT